MFQAGPFLDPLDPIGGSGREITAMCSLLIFLFYFDFDFSDHRGVTGEEGKIGLKRIHDFPGLLLFSHSRD